MHYFSTNGSSPLVSFRDAVLRGQPSDKGLYFPTEIPTLSADLISGLATKSNAEIAIEIIRPFVNGEIPDDILFQICSETVDFDFPIIDINDRISALELFHGPTLAFKDVGARFMSRCLAHFSAKDGEKTIVIVATSGDTGGAVAAGFHNVKGIEVVILYPKGRVSRIQELQLTTLGGNVTALEIRGSFDDCQALAKKALADAELLGKIRLTSANSINVARWLPQQFYYFYALRNWHATPPMVSVPSGNFGNIAAGLMAYAAGLPIGGFIAACNANDVIPRFLESGELAPTPAVATLSNAMDVGNPSNFVRVLEIFHRDTTALKQQFFSVSISDATTAATMREVYQSHGYRLDPHGAVGFRALADHLAMHPGQTGIFLETAHPIKFDFVEKILGSPTPMPDSVRDLFGRESSSVEMDVNYDDLKDIILSKI